MMCCIIWHCLKHEAQNTFSYYLEHLNDDTSLFPPQKCYKDASIILTTTQNYLSLRAKNFHSCRKKFKEEFERSSWLVHTCWGTAANAEDTCPAFISPQYKSSPAQKQVNWYHCRATFICLQRKILTARQDLFGICVTKCLPSRHAIFSLVLLRLFFSLIFSLGHDQSISKTSRRIISLLVC